MLEAKVSKLETDAVTAMRLAAFWRKQIDLYGEPKAAQFYKSLGLNHLETKSTVEWEGMTLSRQPTEAEKLCIKSIASAQEAGKASVGAVLLKARIELIGEALKAIKKLKPATYHTLILEVSDDLRGDLRARLTDVFTKGKRLVATELAGQKSNSPTLINPARYDHRTKTVAETGEDSQELDELADLTDARVANDVQSRITAAATRFALLGLTGAALWEAVGNEINAGSVSYIDRAAQGVANRVLNIGRAAEMEDRSDDIGHYEYSAILDQNTCGACSADDGMTANSPADLPGTPNPECEGSDFCRCFIVAILDTVA